ncbi:S8 family peptidase [Herbaspirillum sp. YR522]|uniref:S8 family peptidase n=1 Tax=Herbaspirillum sp. YR522 TaxID=1144342 RepID=UPI00026F7F9B|nr:S8 family peptidase [Herbaspirillum sp. YR522]EJN03253.1 subtilisin-like serine protease [Herbaspirillum sp. YR522]
MDDIEKTIALELIHQACGLEGHRFTTDFPIPAEAWLLFARRRRFHRPHALLLTPHLEAGISGLRSAVARLLPALERAEGERYIATNESHLLVGLDFYDLLALLPATRWWQQHIANAFGPDPAAHAAMIACDWLRSDALAGQVGRALVQSIKDAASLRRFGDIGPRLVAAEGHAWSTAQHAALAGLLNIACLQLALSLLGIRRPVPNLELGVARKAARVLSVLARCLAGYRAHPHSVPGRDGRHPALWQVSCNRAAEHAVLASRKTIKADAAMRLFDTGGRGIRWAVIDSGIDARHPALARPEQLDPAHHIRDGLCLPSLSRVIRTLDFTRLAAITSGRVPPALLAQLQQRHGTDAQDRIDAIRRDLARGRMLDWTALEPLLEVDQSDPAHYIAPVDQHGTHVAGIIAANWQTTTYQAPPAGPSGARTAATGPVAPATPPELLHLGVLHGVCPEIELLDLRVFDGDHDSDEFAILGALQYVRFLNQSKDRQYVHGVNLSLSLRHDVRNYACGNTPVCLECDRLVGAGIVVVAAAGNLGYQRGQAHAQPDGAYRSQGITDPGNAAGVITVGATHRSDPYQYGVSYFSSRGPTGDGRCKPDLVAPGEKIVSTALDAGVATMDGTSMAAPHVSGAAALLLSRNNELMGKPATVKRILCDSASDLGRERSFQGAGLLDVLRALQSV